MLALVISFSVTPLLEELVWQDAGCWLVMGDLTYVSVHNKIQEHFFDRLGVIVMGGCCGGLEAPMLRSLRERSIRDQSEVSIGQVWSSISH